MFRNFRIPIAVICLLVLSGLAQAAPTGLDRNGHLHAVDPDGAGYVRLENGGQLHVGDRVKHIIFYGPTPVVNENLGENYWEYASTSCRRDRRRCRSTLKRTTTA